MKMVRSCRICLIINTKVYRLGVEGKYLIEDIFRRYNITQEIHESFYVCFECKAVLDKYIKFTKKVVCSQKVLEKMSIQNQNKITVGLLKNLNRKALGISSALNVSPTSMCNYVPELEIDNCKSNNTAQEINEIIEIMDAIDTPINDEPLIFASESKVSLEENYDPLSIKIEETIFEIEETFNNKDEEEILLVADKEISDANKEILDANIEISDANKEILDADKEILDADKEILDADKEISDANVVILSDVDEEILSNANEEILSDVDEEILSDEEKSDDPKKKKKTSSEYEPSDSDFKESLSSDCSYSATGRKINKKIVRNYPLKCDYCSYIVTTAQDHHQHHQIYHRDKEYAFKSKTQLCPHCGIWKPFRAMEDHIRTHSKQKAFLCVHCPLSFNSYRQLYRHTIRNHKVKQYICDYCNKSMRVKCELKLHIRTHTGEKPFKCEICGAAFAHKGNVTIHIKNNHQQSWVGGSRSRKTKRKNTKRARSETSDSDDIPLIKRRKKKQKVKTK